MQQQHHQQQQQQQQQDREDTPGKRKLGKVDRGREACNECRRHKIRCHPHPDDPQHLFPCSRCERMNLSCEFAKHNRGRKRKRPVPLLAGSLLAEGSSSHANGGPGQASSSNFNEEPSTLRSLGDPRFPFISADDAPIHGQPSRTHRYHNDHVKYEEEHRQSHHMSLRRMLGEESSDNDESDESDEAEEEHGGGTNGHGADNGERGDATDNNQRKKGRNAMKGSDLVDDPVRAGFVDEAEARALFHLFMTHYNTSLTMLDPILHTHDSVRQASSFLYTAILCVTSRYLSSLSPPDSNGHQISPESARSVHQQILVLARDHLTWSFAEATTDINVVRAMVVLSINKEPDDDKAGYYISRAVLMGKELNLGRLPPREELDKMSEDQLRHLRCRQRTWLCLFSVNSIFNMQFRQPMLIPQSDPLVATAHHWLKRSRPETLLRDTLLVCSTELRRKYLHYRDLLVGPGPDTPAYRSAVSLSLLTRTMNQDWDVSSEAWIRDIIDEDQIDLGGPNSIPAFHHCLNAATSVLVRFEGLDKQQLTFASDTFLHFALYAATLLSTLCRGQHPYKFEGVEIEHCRRLILKAADAIDAASAYESDSPRLHAWYLRRLCEILPTSAPTAPAMTHQTQLQNPSTATSAIPIDPTLQGMSGGLPVDPTLSTVLGSDLDFLLADFPWVGLGTTTPNAGIAPGWGGSGGWGSGGGMDPGMMMMGGEGVNGGMHAGPPPPIMEASYGAGPLGVASMGFGNMLQ
ncbi:hypothetical protein CI109_103855 [Kwoniella shandongensis]|uniref:Zn(2)-C6 fungal-type domain-containing protein n=1 Tax=Kwoniella shandongensis TaxID=1734106 RepID=A0AAJ8LLD4_9TREE